MAVKKVTLLGAAGVIGQSTWLGLVWLHNGNCAIRKTVYEDGLRISLNDSQHRRALQ